MIGRRDTGKYLELNRTIRSYLYDMFCRDYLLEELTNAKPSPIRSSWIPMFWVLGIFYMMINFIFIQ